jgi:hypothetical protein
MNRLRIGQSPVVPVSQRRSGRPEKFFLLAVLSRLRLNVKQLPAEIAYDRNRVCDLEVNDDAHQPGLEYAPVDDRFPRIRLREYVRELQATVSTTTGSRKETAYLPVRHAVEYELGPVQSDGSYRGRSVPDLMREPCRRCCHFGD